MDGGRGRREELIRCHLDEAADSKISKRIERNVGQCERLKVHRFYIEVTAGHDGAQPYLELEENLASQF